MVALVPRFQSLDRSRRPFEKFLTALLGFGLLTEDRLRSPVDPRPGLSSYSYTGAMPMRVVPEEFILAYETFDDFRLDAERHHLVVFADARVDYLSNSELQARLRTQRRGSPDR